MPAVAAGAMIVGGGIQIYGDIKSANDQASLDQSRADIANKQANEIAAREQSNEAMRNQTAMRQKLQFGSSYAASGKAGTGVGSQLQIQNQADLQNMMSFREATFQENMLRQQAGIDSTMSDSALAAGTMNAIGAGVGALGKAAAVSTAGGRNPGYGGTQGLGAYLSGGSAGGAPGLGSGANGGG